MKTSTEDQAAPTQEADKYLYGGCTENECRLCRLPAYARKAGMSHAGISMHNVPPKEADAGEVRRGGMASAPPKPQEMETEDECIDRLERTIESLRRQVAELQKANADVNASCLKEALRAEKAEAENAALRRAEMLLNTVIDNRDATVESLRRQVAEWEHNIKYWRVIEIMIRNPSVKDVVTYWADRAEKAEAERDALREDAERWNMLPAFLEKYQLNYVGLKRDIDAAIDAARKT